MNVLGIHWDLPLVSLMATVANTILFAELVYPYETSGDKLDGHLF